MTFLQQQKDEKHDEHHHSKHKKKHHAHHKHDHWVGDTHILLCVCGEKSFNLANDEINSLINFHF